jgi:hypothetical protein
MGAAFCSEPELRIGVHLTLCPWKAEASWVHLSLATLVSG